jgi:hypothetical protein
MPLLPHDFKSSWRQHLVAALTLLDGIVYFLWRFVNLHLLESCGTYLQRPCIGGAYIHKDQVTVFTFLIVLNVMQYISIVPTRYV